MSNANEGMLIGMNFANQRYAQKADEIAAGWKEQAESFKDAYESTKAQLEQVGNIFTVQGTATTAGVRSVVRELLEELRKADPNNPYLDKKIRDKVYEFGRQAQLKRQDGLTYAKFEEELPIFRKIVYGAEDSFGSGAVKDQITPNLELRTAIDAPAHITDREKLLRLVERLAAEVKQNNPNADILKEQQMIDVFETHALHEMIRQDKPAR